MATVQVLRAWQGKPLIDVLAIAFGISKKKAKDALDRKKVLLNNKRVWIAKYIVHTGDMIELIDTGDADQAPRTQREVSILFEDEHFLIVNKPPGIITNGEKSFEQIIQKKCRLSKARAVHRLDRDTSGALIVAKNQALFDKFVELFKDAQIEKKYYAIILAQSSAVKPGASIMIDTPLEGKTAHTAITIIKSYPPVHEASIIITTGRTHQIRKHLASRGMQLLGDRQYEVALGTATQYRSVARQLLHAASLSFLHPVTLQRIAIEAPLPDDFLAARKAFRG